MRKAVGVVFLWLAACSNGGLTLESAGLTGGDSAAADDTKPPSGTIASSRFQRAPIRGQFAPKIVPRLADSTPMTVVVTLSGESVAEAQAAKGRKLTRGEKRDIMTARTAEQVGPRAAVEATGGEVIGTFQAALNGLKVRIPANQVDKLRSIPGVVAIKRVSIVHAANVESVQRIQAPVAWAGSAGVPGVHGEHIKIAIVDSGIDYTHANFGGPGTVGAFQQAAATSTAPADPALFGPSAPKVKGGTDLVGDAYDPTGTGDALVPHPDDNPLDCLGHGSHVAGTAAGFGVLANGSTFHGSYDQATHRRQSFNVGPGVAPLADLYAVRVFGCSNSSDVIADGIEWAVAHDVDVINLSVTTAFGSTDSVDAAAADAAVRAGITVVSIAGNDGPIPYVMSSPGSSSGGIAVASTPATSTRRTVNLALAAVTSDGTRTVSALNSNDAPFTSPTTLSAVVLRTGTDLGVGCDPAEYTAQDVVGKIVIVERGVCNRVTKVIAGQKSGAAAVVMINSDDTLPPFEGTITVDADTGEPFVVTIPFFGVTISDGAFLALRGSTAITVAEGPPLKTGTSAFSSAGPRVGDGHLKPEISAPGELIVSTAIGTGTGGIADSGTSMSAPHVAGTAALVLQAHPTWTPAAVKAAIINTGNPDEIADYVTRLNGAGLVNAGSAVATLAYAYADVDEVTLSLGVQEFQTDLTKHGLLHIHNDSAGAMFFSVAAARQNGSPHTVTFQSATVAVSAHGDATVDVTIRIPAATAGNSDDFRDAAGLVVFTPTTADTNHGLALSVPYYVVPRVSADLATTLGTLRGTTPTGNAVLTNAGSAIPASAQFFSWGHSSPSRASLPRIDLRADGVQAFDSEDGKVLSFAVSTYGRWSTFETQEFEILVDTDGDGIADWDIFSADLGLLTAGVLNGQPVAGILNLRTGDVSADFLAIAPTDSSTIQLPVLAASIGITPDNPRLTYTVQSQDLFGTASDATTSPAGFNAFVSAVSNGQAATVAPNTSVAVPIVVNRAEFARTPPLGLMIVAPDNASGAAEAGLIQVKF